MILMKQLFLDGALEGKGGVATISRWATITIPDPSDRLD